jgi:autophagy-related protein 11
LTRRSAPSIYVRTRADEPAQDPTSNPYGLGDGVKYYMLEVEDWTQPTTTKRRVGARRVSSEPHTDNALSPPPPLTPPTDSQVEETFPDALGPNSHLFPSRARSNSTPAAGPSSLSRLLAQAPATEVTSATVPLHTIQQSPVDTRTPSPVATPFIPPPPSPPGQLPTTFPLSDSPLPALSPLPFPASSLGAPPSPVGISSPPHADSFPRKHGSPLRPGSRASRISTTSRLSSGRIPPFTNGSSGPSTIKGTPTTALTPAVPSPPADTDAFDSTPSPAGSLGEGLMSSVLSSRRRTVSYHMGPERQSPPNRRTGNAPIGMSALASLASWGTSLSRKKRMSGTVPPATAIANATGEGTGDSGEPASASARELLSRFEEAGKQ